MPLLARRHLRKMRGGAQSHLLEASDGNYYVVKFRNNPQHRRVLVNELVAALLLEQLGICCAKPEIIEITPEFAAANPEMCLQAGVQRIAVEPGWHFGSRCPGDPDRMAIYDYLPDTLLERAANVSEFRGALVFDKWVSNSDTRQAVFFRARVRDWLGGEDEAASRKAFVSLMIDHGFAFNGPHWDYPESPVQGLYSRKIVYRGVRGLADFEPWLSRAQAFPVETLDRALRTVPPAWIEGDEEALEKLLERLVRRRKKIADLLADCKRANTNPFPEWR